MIANISSLKPYVLIVASTLLILLIVPFYIVNPNKISTGVSAFLVFLAILYIILPHLSKEKTDQEFVKKIALTAFIIRSITALILVASAIYIRGDTFGGWSFANDGYRYLNASVRMLEFVEQEGTILELLESRDKWKQIAFISNYYPLIAFVLTYTFGGISSLLPGSIYSAFMGTLTVILIYKMAQLLFPPEEQYKAKNAALMAVFFPSYILFSSVFLKESTVIFITCLTLYLFARACKTKNVFLIMMIIALIGIVGLIRFYAAGAIAFAILSALFILSINLKNPLNTIFSLVKVVLLLGVVLFFGGKLLNFEFLLKILDFDRLETVRNLYYGAGNTFFSIGDLSSPMGVVKAIPIGMIYLFLSPFPWQWFVGNDFIERILAPDMILYYMVFPSAVIGLVKLIRERNPMALAILMYMLALSIPYSILVGNFGTIYRLRTQLLPYIFILAAVGGVPFIEYIKNALYNIYVKITRHDPYQKNNKKLLAK